MGEGSSVMGAQVRLPVGQPQVCITMEATTSFLVSGLLQIPGQLGHGQKRQETAFHLIIQQFFHIGDTASVCRHKGCTVLGEGGKVTGGETGAEVA